ncbi:hypothetical protein [Maribacter sp. 2304DJ31-5]|uniref:hypothetical protein n=1 Tax=Maribacter sp. 2304DJ31-5 TaxID=3386273 RepID=UPI0039BC5E49
MTKGDLFQKSDMDLFHPEGIEFISTILFGLGYTYENLSTKQARDGGLEVIELLFDLELIEVFHWGNYNEKLNGTELSKKQILNYIEELWFEGTDVPDFYGMPMFKYKNWYINALKKEGFQFRGMDWKTFVNENIGDLEKWIEENRPNSTKHK